jgi:oxygen-independent coproporphyrinogen-3 oxidase
MQDTLPFIRPLVEKYDRPGPRYTSYTTASQFQAAVNRIQSEAQVVELGSAARAGMIAGASRYIL